MFWITFFVSGLIVASIPWVASHFSNKIAGFVVLIPIMMAISFTVQYLAHGQKAATEMIIGSLLGLPALAVFGLVIILSLKNQISLPLALLFGLIGWAVVLFCVYQISGR